MFKSFLISGVCLKNIKSQLRDCLPLQWSSRFTHELKKGDTENLYFIYAHKLCLCLDRGDNMETALFI